MHHSYKYLMVTLYHNYFIKLLALSTASIGFASILRIFVSRLIRAIGFLSFNVFVWLWYQGNPGFKRWVQKCSLLFSFWYSLRKIGTNSFKVSENSPVFSYKSEFIYMACLLDCGLKKLLKALFIHLGTLYLVVKS